MSLLQQSQQSSEDKRRPILTANLMRDIIANYIRINLQNNENDLTIKEWLRVENEGYDDVEDYIEKLKKGLYGGQMEILLCSRIFKVNVDVYREIERETNKFVLTHHFACEEESTVTINIVYSNGNHYDSLMLD